MITDDHLLIAKETARVLGMGDHIKSAQGLVSLLDVTTKKRPENLGRDYGFAQVECLRDLGYKVG
jgi:hypothetical protein